MASWDDLATAAPELAENGRRLLKRTGIGEALLATVRGDATPRLHPVYAEIVAGRLLTFVASTSAKAADLRPTGGTLCTPTSTRGLPTSSSSAAERGGLTTTNSGLRRPLP